MLWLHSGLNSIPSRISRVPQKNGNKECNLQTRRVEENTIKKNNNSQKMARKGKKKNHKQPALSESTKEESPNIEINHSDSKFKSKARDACKIKMLRA